MYIQLLWHNLGEFDFLRARFGLLQCDLAVVLYGSYSFFVRSAFGSHGRLPPGDINIESTWPGRLTLIVFVFASAFPTPMRCIRLALFCDRPY